MRCTPTMSAHPFEACQVAHPGRRPWVGPDARLRWRHQPPPPQRGVASALDHPKAQNQPQPGNHPANRSEAGRPLTRAHAGRARPPAPGAPRTPVCTEASLDRAPAPRSRPRPAGTSSAWCRHRAGTPSRSRSPPRAAPPRSKEDPTSGSTTTAARYGTRYAFVRRVPVGGLVGGLVGGRSSRQWSEQLYIIHKQHLKIGSLMATLMMGCVAGLALGETGPAPVGPPGGDGGRFRPGWNGMAR